MFFRALALRLDQSCWCSDVCGLTCIHLYCRQNLCSKRHLVLLFSLQNTDCTCVEFGLTFWALEDLICNIVEHYKLDRFQYWSRWLQTLTLPLVVMMSSPIASLPFPRIPVNAMAKVTQSISEFGRSPVSFANSSFQKVEFQDDYLRSSQIILGLYLMQNCYNMSDSKIYACLHQQKKSRDL